MGKNIDTTPRVTIEYFSLPFDKSIPMGMELRPTKSPGCPKDAFGKTGSYTIGRRYRDFVTRTTRYVAHPKTFGTGSRGIVTN